MQDSLETVGEAYTEQVLGQLSLQGQQKKKVQITGQIIT